MDDNSLKRIALKDAEYIKVHGRTTKCREPLTLFWTASGIECNVSGTAFWIEIEVTYEQYEPWLSYTVNGDWIGRQMLPAGRYWIPLFRGMNPQKKKNVRIYKDLQAMSGDGKSYIQIHAIRTDGVLYPVADKKWKLEFIGDSITSGEGTIGAKEEEDWIPMFFSSLKDYAYETAKKLDADYQVFSQSGWGVLSSWDNNPHGAIPDYYTEICSLIPGEKNRELGGMEKYDFTSWKPDCIIVNLGTNDGGAFEQPPWQDPDTGEYFCQEKNPDGSYRKECLKRFQAAVIAFLEKIRGCNPEAYIVWCYGMIGTPLLIPICEAIAEYIGNTNDRKVSFLQLPNTNDENVGSRAHPGWLCHKQAADVLSEYINGLLR